MKIDPRKLALVPMACLLAAACDDTSSTALDAPPPAAAFIPGGTLVTITDPSQLGEKYVICKYGPDSQFNVYDNGTLLGTVTVADGECRTVFQSGGETLTISSEEIAQGGVTLDAVFKTQLTCGLGLGDNCDPANFPNVTGPTLVTDPVSGFVGGTGPSGDRSVWGLSGVLAEYFNSRGEGEGCTPGFWKQPHHFDSWPAPYAPNQLFSTYFENAYPGMTLLQVLTLKGNTTGLEALGRHTVAALLNSASVGFGMTTQEVIDAFNAVFPGTKAQYNTLKNTFAALNESVCPLS